MAPADTWLANSDKGNRARPHDRMAGAPILNNTSYNRKYTSENGRIIVVVRVSHLLVYYEGEPAGKEAEQSEWTDITRIMPWPR